MTREQYQEMLDDHDWFYYMSDDMRTYNRGLEKEKELKRLADKNEDFERMLNDKHDEMFK